MFRKEYVSPALEIHAYSVSGCILTGSLTDKAIKAGTVRVHEYEKGFDTVPGIDFESVGFDE